MDKIKQNKIWITIVVIGIIVIAILLAMLHQQKQNSPEAQSASYVSSAKAASASTSVQDKNNEKAYAKKAASMQGHVLIMGENQVYFTTWTAKEFKNWASNYLALSEYERHKDGVKESFGTPVNIENSDTNMLYPLDNWAKQIESIGTPSDYFSTVKAYNKQYPGVNPDDIKK
ncbi:MAG: hypothetical protein ABF933_02175 [Leuconostoc citreum]